MRSTLPLDHLGEIIEASTTEFTAQCFRLHEPPAFGTFVKIAPRIGEEDPFESVKEGTLFGLVYNAVTASIEPNRRPAAFGLEEEALRREQPQIYELLATDFSALLVGFVEGGRVRTYLPPYPPHIHARVMECASGEVCALTEQPDYLRAVLRFPGFTAADELMAAAIRHAWRCRGEDGEYLVLAGKEVALLLRDDYDRLNAVLQKITP